MRDSVRRIAAEALGTAILVATVVGSGIMADRLTDDVALALLCNALATGAILVVLIATLAPVSGAHFNPAVTLVMAVRRDITVAMALAYVAAQIAGGLAGAALAHGMFEVPLAFSGTPRTGYGQWLSEVVAAAGLVLVILGAQRQAPAATAWLVGLFIASAYWFTASTSFANPAVTIARAITDTFPGIRPADVLPFVIAQLIGAFVALLLSHVLWLRRERAGE
jgi:glycerol uptake facilitator-like aquaporin